MANQVNGLLSPYLRDKRIKSALPYLKGKVLDFGCGIGKLSEYIEDENYIGIDIDEESIKIAKKFYPNKQFYLDNEFEEIKDALRFDSIVSLAVIEHVKNPHDFLLELKSLLNQKGSIVLTTPHPYSDWIHDIGSSIGFFSKHANEEHEELIDKNKMAKLSKESGMDLKVFKRFLFGVNQLFVLQ
jgi:2-polyprenyl-3-methyl-5-hydroxy-6-metoxy-1,4-benzoquinol methylase